MDKKTILVIAGLIILIILGVMFFFPRKIENGVKNGEKTINLTKQDGGKEISASVGDIIQVELEGAGATGYWWYLDNLDTDYLQLISEDTKMISDQNMVGAPVTGIWKFRMLKAGQVEIKMDYYRSWEGKESASDHFSIKVLIE